MKEIKYIILYVLYVCENIFGTYHFITGPEQ